MPLSRQPGGSQRTILEPVPYFSFTSTAVVATANLAYLGLIKVDKAVAVTQMSYLCSTASGNVDLGIYTFDGSSTYTRIASTGSTAAAGTNVIQTIALTAAVTLAPFTSYYLAFAADNTTLVTSRIVPTGALWAFGSRAALGKGTSFPLPTSIASPTAQAYMPWIGAS